MSESTWQWLIGTLISVFLSCGATIAYLLGQDDKLEKKLSDRADKIGERQDRGEDAHDTLLKQIHAQRMEDSRVFYENSRSLEDRLVGHLERLREDMHKKTDGIMEHLMSMKRGDR